MQTLPTRIDLFALVILLGVAQGLFLGVFFLSGPSVARHRGQILSNRCLGWLMLALSAVSAEIFLNYTNYMFRVLWLVDVSEPVNFVLGPLFYFFVFSRIRQRLPRHWYWHFLPFGIWLLNSVTWLYQPIEFKYNSYVNSQHPELPYVPQHLFWEDDFTGLRHLINVMTLLSCVVYAVLALLIIRDARHRGSLSRQSVNHRVLPVLSWLFALVPILIAVVKSRFYNDVGDYLLASYIAGTVYATSFLVMRGSLFFADESAENAPTEPPEAIPDSPAGPKRKYEKSSLSEEVEDAVMIRLTRLLETEKPYVDSGLSLPKLAGRLDASPHHLSQLLNDRLGITFFDWLATHRIAEAQYLLSDPATAHLKIDEIAERVGYNSPSAFHTAFKRLTKQTPAQFRETAGQTTKG